MASTRHNIVLTGFMGTGKSAVGRRLAEVSGREFVDLDQEIIAKHGEIAKIFEKDGEERFREIERTAVADVAPQRNLVVATGGGTMLDPDNVVAFLGADIFTLTADSDTILKRVQDDGIDGRPLLAETEDPKAEIERLLNERAEAYDKFTPIDTTDMSVDEVVSAIGAAGGDVESEAQTLSERVTEGEDGDPREAILRLLIAGIAVILIILVIFVLAF